jgi:hypothetical protein
VVGSTVICNRRWTLDINGKQPVVEPVDDTPMLGSDVKATAPLFAALVVKRIETALGIHIPGNESSGALVIVVDPIRNLVCARQQEGKGQVQATKKGILTSFVRPACVRITVGIEKSTEEFDLLDTGSFTTDLDTVTARRSEFDVQITEAKAQEIRPFPILAVKVTPGMDHGRFGL